MSECPACPLLREQIQFLKDQLAHVQSEKGDILKHLVNVADASALSRIEAAKRMGVPPSKDPAPRPVLSPQLQRQHRDLPTDDEIRRFAALRKLEDMDAPAEDNSREAVEAEFQQTAG